MIGTPTCNTALPLQLGGFDHLAHALDHAARGQTGINFHDVQGRLQESLSYADLRLRALVAAAWLQRLGLQPGQRIAVIANTSPEFITLFYAAQYIGVVPCPLPFNLFPGNRSAYTAQLAALLAACDAQQVFSPRAALASATDAAAGRWPVLPLETLQALDPGSVAHVEQVIDTQIPAYVQFSSGSTSTPKGVVVRQQALMANADAIARDGLRLRADDRACSWLPLYHDMGMVGFSIVPVCSQRSVDYLQPHVFAARPGVWLELMSRQRTSIVYAPGFAWQLAARRCGTPSTLDLAGLRVAGVGGDHVRSEDLDAFAEAMAAVGFQRTAFQCSYGLAEATLAVCMGKLESAPRYRPAPGEAQRVLLGCGQPLPGTAVQVRDAQSALVPAGEVGHVWIRGPSVLQHYLHETTTTALPDADGWLDTGDLGYLDQGELFVTGRAKDLIIIRGRNLWPQDIEAAVAEATTLDLRDIAVLAAAEEGRDHVQVLVQGTRPSAPLEETIADTLATAFGVRCEVQYLPARSLPYTTSGKLARNIARSRFAAHAGARTLNEGMETDA